MQLAVNEIDSAIVTHAKGQQDPAAVVDKSSGLNVADFQQNRNTPGRVFPVNSTRTTPVTYLQKPDLPKDISATSDMLISRIEKVTGVGSLASGQDSHSLQTAGGISQLLSQASLKDKKVIDRLANYLLDLYNGLIAHIQLKTGLIRYAAQDHVQNEVQYKVLDLSQID